MLDSTTEDRDPVADRDEKRFRGRGWARSAVFRRLERLVHGRLILIEGERRIPLRIRESFIPSGESAAPEVTIRVLRNRFYRRIALGGGVGAGEPTWTGTGPATICPG